MVYRIFGLIPFPFHYQSISTSAYKKWKPYFEFAEKLWLVCLILFEFYSLVFNSNLVYQHFSHSNGMNSYYIFRKFIVFTIHASVVVITLESYRHRNVQVEIIRQLQEIDLIFAQKLKLQIDYQRLKRSIFVAFLKWTSVYTIMILILSTIYILENVSTGKDPRYLLWMYPLTKKAFFASAYTTYVILIEHRIQAMHQVFDTNLLLVNESKFEISIDQASHSEYEAFELQRLVHLWRLYPHIHATIQCINDTFKWSVSIIFLTDILDISQLLFYTFETMNGSMSGLKINLTCYSVAFIGYYLFAFATFTRLANSLAKEAEKIPPKIHRLILDGAISEPFQDFVSRIQPFDKYAFLLSHVYTNGWWNLI